VIHDIFCLVAKGVVEELVGDILFDILDLTSSVLCEVKADVPCRVKNSLAQILREEGVVHLHVVEVPEDE
jgi:hypothetical protein